MRFVLYNMRYGTGGYPWSSYLRRTSANLQRIGGFLGELDPDVVGLVEVDAGSFRSARRNQAELLAAVLGHYHTYRSKYHEASWARVVPVFNKQGNAFLTRDNVRQAQFHYFNRGMKRLVIELDLEGVRFFLVHLSLVARVRHRQLGELYGLVSACAGPKVVAGDFNALWGEQEIALFLAATRLRNANTVGQPTFPSWRPRRHLDFVLYSEGIEPRALRVPDVRHSDHLPMVFDFDVR